MAKPINFKEKRPIKDANAARKAQTWSVFGGFGLTFCLAGALLGFLYGGWPAALAGLALGFAASLLATFALGFLADGVSDNVGRFVFLGKRAHWTLHEGLQSDLQQIRYAKASERYGEALSKVEQVLKKAPQWPEALFLKAEILWDGFEALNDSKDALRKIIALTAPSDPYNVWAREMLKKLSQIRREPAP